MKKTIKSLFKSESINGMILIISSIIAIVLANNDLTSESYYNFFLYPAHICFSGLDIGKNLLLWINDALMALFFLMIGIEIKRELVVGELASLNRAIFPVIASIGGMFAPGMIFLLFNYANEATRSGWPIPITTDIAFAMGVLSLLHGKILPALKVFLMVLAIIDDLGAIIVLLFYRSVISVFSMEVACGIILVFCLLNFYNLRNILVYMIFGILLWIAILKSGIHPTLAGVITGFFIPLSEKKGTSPAKNLVRNLKPFVNWFVLPLFAFANAGISFSEITFKIFLKPEFLGILLGLFVGKPIGITMFSWIAFKSGFAVLPKAMKIWDIAAISVLCGIGFTMSIFISSVAFDPKYQELLIFSKFGVFSASILSAFIGYWLLRIKYRRIRFL